MATQIQGGVAGINQVISAVVAEDDDSIVTNSGVTVHGLEAAAYVFGQVLSNYPEAADTLNRTDKIFSMPDGNGGTTMISLNELSDIIHAKYGYDPLVEFSAGVGTTSYSLADIEFVLNGIMERYDTMDFPLAQTGIGTSNEVTNATGLSVQVATALSQLKAYLTNSLGANSFANGASIDYSSAVFKNSANGTPISFNDVLNKIEGATGVNLRDVLGTSFNNGTQLTGQIANDIYAFFNANKAAGVANLTLPDASHTANATDVDQLGDELLNIQVSNVVLNRSLLDLGNFLPQLSHTDFENDTDSLDLDKAAFDAPDIAQRAGLPVGSKVSLNQILHDTVMQHNIDLKELLPEIFTPGANSIHYQKVQDLETVLNQSVGTSLTPGSLTPLYMRGTLTTETLPDGSSKALTSNELAVFRLRQFLKNIPETSWDEFIGGVGYLNSQDPSKLISADDPYNTGHLISFPALLDKIKAETGVNPENIILGKNLPANAEQDLTYSDLKVYLRAINTYLGIAPGTGLDELSFSAPVLTDEELGNLNTPLTPAESADLDSEFQAILNQQVQAANAVGVSQNEIDTVKNWLSGLASDFSSITLPPNYVSNGVTYTYAPPYFNLSDLLAGGANQQVSASTQAFAYGAAQTGTPNQTHVLASATAPAGLMSLLGLDPTNSNDVLEAKRILNAVIPGLVTKDGHVTLAAVNATSNFFGLQTRGVFTNPGQFLDNIAATVTALNGAASTTASAFKTSLLSHLGWSAGDATAAPDALTGLAAISPSFANKLASGQAITAADLATLQAAIASKRSSFVASPEASFLTAISPQPNPAMYITQPSAYVDNLVAFLTNAQAAITNSTPTAANGTTINSVTIRAADLLSGITPDIQIATTTNGVSATQTAAAYYTDQSRQLFGNLFTGSGLSATNDEDRTTLLSTLSALSPDLAGKIRAGANITAADLTTALSNISANKTTFTAAPFTAITNAEYTNASNFGLALKKLGEYIAANSSNTVGGVKQITLADLQSGTHGVTSAWIQAFSGLGYPSDLASATTRLQADLAKYTPTLSTSFAAAGGVLTQTNLDTAAVSEVKATLQELRPMYYLQQLSAGLAAMKADIAAGTFSTNGLVSTNAPATFESANTGWATKYFPNLGYGTSLVGGKAQAKDDFYQDLTMFCPDLAQKIIPALTALNGGAAPTYTLTTADLTTAIATLATTVSNLQTDPTSVTMLLSADRMGNSLVNFTMVTPPPDLPPLPVPPVLQTSVPSDYKFAGGFTEAQLTAAANDLKTLGDFSRLGNLNGKERVYRANWYNAQNVAGQDLGVINENDSLQDSRWPGFDPDTFRWDPSVYNVHPYLRPDDIYAGSSRAYAVLPHGTGWTADTEVSITTDTVSRPSNLLSDLGNPTQANYDTFVSTFATGDGGWTRWNLQHMPDTVSWHIQTEKDRLISGYQADYNKAYAKYQTDLANYNSIRDQRAAYNTAVTANQSMIANHQVMLRSSSFGYMEMAQHIVEENPLDFQAQIDQLNALITASNGAPPVVTTPPAVTAQTVDLTTARVAAAKIYISNLLASDSSLQSPYIDSATAQNVITGSASTTALTWQSTSPGLLAGFTNAQVQTVIDALQTAATFTNKTAFGGDQCIYNLGSILQGDAPCLNATSGLDWDKDYTGPNVYTALGLDSSKSSDVAKLNTLLTNIGNAGNALNTTRTTSSDLNSLVTGLTNAKNANIHGSATASAAGTGLYGVLGLDPTKASDQQIYQNTLAQLGITGRLTQSTGNLTAQDLQGLLNKLSDSIVLNAFGNHYASYVQSKSDYSTSKAAYDAYQTNTAPLQVLVAQAMTQKAALDALGGVDNPQVTISHLNDMVLPTQASLALTYLQNIQATNPQAGAQPSDSIFLYPILKGSSAIPTTNPPNLDAHWQRHYSIYAGNSDNPNGFYIDNADSTSALQSTGLYQALGLDTGDIDGLNRIFQSVGAPTISDPNGSISYQDLNSIISSLQTYHDAHPVASNASNAELTSINKLIDQVNINSNPASLPDIQTLTNKLDELNTNATQAATAITYLQNILATQPEGNYYADPAQNKAYTDQDEIDFADLVYGSNRPTVIAQNPDLLNFPNWFVLSPGNGWTTGNSAASVIGSSGLLGALGLPVDNNAQQVIDPGAQTSARSFLLPAALQKFGLPATNDGNVSRAQMQNWITTIQSFVKDNAANISKTNTLISKRTAADAGITNVSLSQTQPVSPFVDLNAAKITAANTYINNLLASDSSLQSPYIDSGTAQNVINGSASTTPLSWQGLPFIAGFTNAQVQTVITYLTSAANTLPADGSASYGLSDVLSGIANATTFGSPPTVYQFSSSGNNLWSQLGLDKNNQNDLSKLGNLFSSLSTGLNTGSYTRSQYLSAINKFQTALNANTQNTSATAVAAGTGLYGVFGLDPTKASDRQIFQNTLAQLGITGRLTQSTGNLSAQDLQGLLAKLNDQTVLTSYNLAARQANSGNNFVTTQANLATARANLSNVTYADALKQVQQLTTQVAADLAAYNAASGVERGEKMMILTARQTQLDAANARLSTIRANDLDQDVITGGEAYLYQYADRIKQFVTNAPDPLTYGNTKLNIGGEMRSLKDVDADLKRNFGITLISTLIGNSISDTTSISKDQLKSLVNGIEAFSMSDRMHSHFLGLGYNVTPTSFMGRATSIAELAGQIGGIYAQGSFPKPDNVGMGTINGKPVVLSGDALAANRIQYWLASTNIGSFVASNAGDGSAPLYSSTPGAPILMGDDPYNPGHQISFADLMDKIKAEPARGTFASDASQKVYRLKELIQEARSKWPTTEFTPRIWMKELGFDPSSGRDISSFMDFVGSVAPSLNVNSWGLTPNSGADIALSNSITLAGLTSSLTGYDDRGTTYINAHNQAPTEDPVLLATLGPDWTTQRLNITQVTQLATALDPLVGHGCKINDMLFSATDPAGRSFTGAKASVALLEVGLQALIDAGTASGNGGKFGWATSYTVNGQSYSVQGIDQLAQRAGLGNLLTTLRQANGYTATTAQGESLQELQALLTGLKNFNGANTPLRQDQGFGAYRSGSELQAALNSALTAANAAQATRDNPDGNPFTVNMNWMLDGSDPARQDFTFHNLDDATDFETVKATLQSFQFVDVNSAQAPDSVRAAAAAAPNVLNEAPLSSTELKKEISSGDLYIDSHGVFYLNRQRTNARDLVLASRMVAGDKLEDQLTGLMNNINNRNVDIQIAKELETCTTETDFKAKLTELKTKYGVDDVMSRITGGSQTDANYGDYSKVSGILQGVIDVKTKDAELDQQNLQNLNNQIEANNTAMTTLLKAFEELMKGLIQALH